MHMRARKRVSPISINNNVAVPEPKKKSKPAKVGAKSSAPEEVLPDVEHVVSVETPVVADEVAAEITAQTEDVVVDAPVTGARARAIAARKAKR